VFLSKSYGIFGNDGLTRRCVRRNKNRITHLQVIDGFFLECIEFEGVLQRNSVGGTSARKAEMTASVPGEPFQGLVP
jgi:hypothetical protein